MPPVKAGFQQPTRGRGRGFGRGQRVGVMLEAPQPEPPPPPKKKKKAKNDDDEYEAGTGKKGNVITGILKRKQIHLITRTYLLIALVIITGLCVAAVINANSRISQHGYPPPYFAKECTGNAYTSIVLLIVISPVGFVVLKFRIANMMIGVGYMFLLVLCIIFPVKALINGFLSNVHDTDEKVKQYLSSEANLHQLHKFWAFFQKAGGCCGTMDIDRVEDWPYFLNTTNLPPSCCTENILSKLGNSSQYCGTGFARTRNKGVSPFDARFPRIPSGFYLSLKDAEKTKLRDDMEVVIDPERYLVQQLHLLNASIVKKSSTEAFGQSWRSYFMDSRCNREYFLRYWQAQSSTQSTPLPPQGPQDCETVKTKQFYNDMGSPSYWDLEKPVETVGLIYKIAAQRQACYEGAGLIRNLKSKAQRDEQYIFNTTLTTAKRIEDYCNKLFPEWRKNQTTIGRKLLLNLDYLTTYINELADVSKSQAGDIEPAKIKSSSPLDSMIGRWVLWTIPTKFDPGELHPYKLAANLLRVHNASTTDTSALKKMYYMSRGISENYVLSGLISAKPCGAIEQGDAGLFENKLARDMNTRFMEAGPLIHWQNPLEGLGPFFLNKVRWIVIIAQIASGIDIFFVIVIAIVFWQYYSRIKAEEYANKRIPKEFEVLHLRRGSLIDASDVKHEAGGNKTATAAATGEASATPKAEGQ